MLVGQSQNTFERLLVEDGYLTSEQLEELRQESVEGNKSIINILSERKLLDRESVVKTVAKAENVPYANLRNLKVDEELFEIIPKDLARNYQVVPIGWVNGKLAIGMVDPTNLQAVDYLSRKINQPIIPHMVSAESVNAIMSQYKADVSRDVSSVVGSIEEFTENEAEEEKEKQQEQQKNNLSQDTPITQALNTILEYAAQMGTSDIHIEPRKGNVKIRFRVDGILLEVMEVPKQAEAALVSRVKIMSNLKIDEHMTPQDGEFQFNSQDRVID